MACGSDAPAPLPNGPNACASADECTADQFCGLRSHTCVPKVDRVAAGTNHTCALHHDGRVSCWGLAEAISAGGPSILSANYVDTVKGAKLLTAGEDLSCAATGSKVQCWGDRAYDVQRDDNAPLFPVSALSLGPGFGCAATSDGTRCWGRNDQGQLARPLGVTDSAGAVLSNPGSISLLATGTTVMTYDGSSRLCAWGDNRSLQITNEPGIGLYVEPVCAMLADVVELAIGDVHACARHGNGQVDCWGERYYGQLGLGGDITDDVPPFGGPALLPGPALQVVAGQSHTCTLIQGGQVVCFGINSDGQVGPSGTESPQENRTPLVVDGFSEPVVALGSGSRANHTCAILDTGGVECWGDDSSGQLGDGQSKIEMGRHSANPVTVQF